MTHKQTKLAFFKGFGSILHCSCGLYHINLPWVSIHLNEDGFDQLFELLLRAKEEREMQQAGKAGSNKEHLMLVH